MRLSKIFAVAIASLALASCDHVPKIPIISTNKPVPITAPPVTPMSLKGVKWQVYDLATLKTMVAGMEARGETKTVIYVLDQDNYKALALNLSEMKRYITDQKIANDHLTAGIAINEGGKPK